MDTARVRIGEMLLQAGAIDGAAVSWVLERQEMGGGRFASVCGSLGLTDERKLATCLAEQRGLPTVVMEESVIAVAMVGLLPARLSTTREVLALETRGNRLLVACADPLEGDVEDEIRYVTGRRPVGVLALEGPLKRGLKEAVWASSRSDHPLLVGGAVGEGERQTPRVALVKPTEGPIVRVPGAPAEHGGAAAVDGSLAAGAGSDRAKSGNRPKLVLIVDDEPDIRDTIATFLERPGLEIVTCGDGTTALTLISRHHPDLIVLDAMLPGMHGFEVCRRIKSSEPFSSIPVIMISAVHRGLEIRDDARRRFGAEEYLEKPFDLDRFCSIVDTYLSRPGDAKAPVAELTAEAMAAAREGKKLLEGGSPREAAAILEKAVRLSPFHPQLHYLCGVAYREIGSPYHAITCFERTVELERGHFSALKDLAMLYQKTGFRSKARQIWLLALEAAPNPGAADMIRSHLPKLY